MIKIKQLEDKYNIEGKRVLLRVDFNVPINDGSITESSRIEKVLPTIKSLINKKAKIVIISHLGRPKGKIVPELTLKPIATKLSSYLNQDVFFLNSVVGENVVKKSKETSHGEILMLENLRFFEGEESNSQSFAKDLSKNADIYINEAFSCSHRAHASVSAITKHIESYAGEMMLKEINVIKMLTNGAKKPVTCIIGGSKISSKIGVIKNLIPKFDNIIIVGGMANNILSHKGIQIGKSIREENCETIINEIFQTSKNYSCKIIYPEDVLTGKNINDTSQAKELNNIKEDDLILDIGPNTVNKIKKIIDISETVLWNGPAGYFENPNFANGSYEIAKAIVKKNKDKSIYSVVGGGDTIALLNQINAIKDFNFVSTAGGAFLEYLEGKELPGIKALN